MVGHYDAHRQPFSIGVSVCMFSDKELEYLTSQRLARFATVSSKGQPTVDAVGFVFDPQQQRFYIGGHNLPASRKYRNIAAGNRQVALIIDDLASVQPWAPRGIKVHGTAAIVQREGQFGPGDYFAITPTISWSWGIVAAAFQSPPNRIEWNAA